MGIWGSFTEQFSTGPRLQILKQRQNMLRALPHWCRQRRRAAPSHQTWAATPAHTGPQDTPPPLQPQGPLDTEANCAPHRLKVPKSVPRQTEQDPQLPQKPWPSQPVQGALSPPALHLWPGPSSAQSLPPAQAPACAALLPEPPFHSTARGDMEPGWASGEAGLGAEQGPQECQGRLCLPQNSGHPFRLTIRLAVDLSPALAEQKTGSEWGKASSPQPRPPDRGRDPAPGPCPQPSTRGGPSSQPTRQMEAARQKGSPFPACVARADTAPPVTSRWALPETSTGRPEVKKTPHGDGGWWQGRGQEAGSRSRTPGPRGSLRGRAEGRVHVAPPGSPPCSVLTARGQGRLPTARSQAISLRHLLCAGRI